MTRMHPAIRDELFSTLGFVRCDELVWPEELGRVLVTNPDAPAMQHVIELTVAGERCLAAPLCVWDGANLGDYPGSYLEHALARLLVVRCNGSRIAPVLRSGEPALVSPELLLTHYTDAIGFSSSSIQPEEVLAEGFAQLVSAGVGASLPAFLGQVDSILARVSGDRGGLSAVLATRLQRDSAGSTRH